MPTFRCNVCEAFNRLANAAPPRCSACEARLDVSGKPEEVDGDALTRAIARSPVPVFVDFWAPWCGPCLISTPMVKALGAKMAGQIVVLAVNLQESPETGEKHAIYAIPTFAIFQHGEEVARQTGVLPRGAMERWVRGVLQPQATEARP